MKFRWFAAAIMPVIAWSAEPLAVDFETPLTGRTVVGDYLLNPTGKFYREDIPLESHKSRGHLKLIGDGRLTVACRNVQSGEVCRISCFMKGKGVGVIHIQWLKQGRTLKFDDRLCRLSAEEYREFSLTVPVPEGADLAYPAFFPAKGEGELLLDDLRIEISPEKKKAAVLHADFTGEHERFSIYRKGENIELLIRGEGELPAEEELEWSLRDWLGREIRCGKNRFSGPDRKAGEQFVLEPPELAGCYFLYLRLRNSGATIPFKGSRFPGFVTFGVLPDLNALELDSPEKSRFGGQGTNFIQSGKLLQGNYAVPMYPTVGMRWTYYGMPLSDLAYARPQGFPRSSEWWKKYGTTPCTAEAGMTEVFDLHGIPANLLRLPAFVKIDRGRIDPTRIGQAFPLKDPQEYARLVGLAAKDLRGRREAFFPAQKHSYYQLHWEPDWHWMGTEEEFIDIYRIASSAIRENDPGALLMGANFGVIDRGCDRMESLFRKGLNQYLDGVLIHLYFLPVGQEPEAAGLPENCRRIRKLTDRFLRPGAPLINTEWGVDYRGLNASEATEADLMTHLSRFVRGHLIALGEGFNATWFFYTADNCRYDKDGGEQGYGMSFNTSDYIRQCHSGAASIEPKPTMMAAAAMIRLLEATRTLGRLSQLPSDIFAYAFRRNGENLVAAWTPAESATLRLETGMASCTVYDVMGNPRRVDTRNGVLNLELNRYPQYIVGLDDRYLPLASRQENSIFRSPHMELAVGDDVAKVLRKTFRGTLVLRTSREEVALGGNGIPEELPAGCYELAALDRQGKQLECMLLELVGSADPGPVRESVDEKGKTWLELPLRNRSGKLRHFQIAASYDKKCFFSGETDVEAHGTRIVKMPIAGIGYTGLALGDLVVEVSEKGRLQAECRRKFGMLFPSAVSTVRIDGNLDEWKPECFSPWIGKEALVYQARSHRGAADFSVSYAIGTYDGKLNLAFRIRDDTALTTTDPDRPWREDSLLLALGHDPAPQGGFRQVRIFSFTRNSGGGVDARELFGCPPVGTAVLPPGTLDAAVFRDDKKEETRYELALPLSLFGENAADKPPGLGISLNDADKYEEITGDLHREIGIAGGVPLFMGNVKFASLFLSVKPDSPEKP